MTHGEPTASRARILIVDDHPASRYGTERILRNAGFDTLEADTGLGTLQRAAEGVDLIVLDVNLPDMDGFEVCRRLRERRETAYVPIVYLSATFTNSIDIQHGLLAGADSYLTHPVEPVVLLATVRALLFGQASEAIRRRTDARFRTVFQLTSGGIALLDSKLHFMDVNPAFCELAGRDKAELERESLSHIVSGDNAEQLDDINQQLLASGRWEGLVPITRRDGSQAFSEWRIVVEAETGARIVMATDVTERLQTEQDRERLLASERAARAEADRSNQLKDEFLAMLSHELRNPLAAILGWASLLRRTSDLAPQVRQGIEAIERNSRVQAHLTSDLLDFAGIQFGKMRLELAVMDPMLAVDAALEIIAPQAREKDIDLGIVRRTDECSVLGDSTRLQQVVWNLLTNAVKFTPRGGTIRVSAVAEGSWFQLDVVDSGKGISAEFLPHLFDRFSQQDSGRAKSYSGLGIGLTIVKHLMQQHQGTIEGYSAGEDQGSTFRVRLPLTPLPRRDVPEKGSVRLTGLKVLVVEDFQDARTLIVRLLSEAGAQVTEAESGDRALEQIRHSLPDVLISDIGMARMDGYELIRTVRSRGFAARQLPAIALTAFVRQEERSAALEAGFQMHLGKPITAQALLAAVAQVHAEAISPEPC